MSNVFLEAEPFGEIVRCEHVGQSNEMLKFGYRVAGSEIVLASVEVPVSVVQRVIPESASVRLSSIGTISANLEFHELGGATVIKENSLLHLVEQLLETQNLLMEEIRASDLDALLGTVETSIRIIKAAIANLVALETRAS